MSYDNSRRDRRAINRENAQKSTGPTSPEGKAISSRNALRHGIAGHFAVIAGEDQETYDQLLLEIHQGFEPQTYDEEALVNEMAQAQWQAIRARNRFDTLFESEFPHSRKTERQLELYRRYKKDHERSYHKARKELLAVQKERLADDLRFLSRKQREARDERIETRRMERHDVDMQLKYAHLYSLPDPREPRNPSSGPKNGAAHTQKAPPELAAAA